MKYDKIDLSKVLPFFKARWMVFFCLLRPKKQFKKTKIIRKNRQIPLLQANSNPLAQHFRLSGNISLHILRRHFDNDLADSEVVFIISKYQQGSSQDFELEEGMAILILVVYFLTKEFYFLMCF